jgi:hypothetical protein
MGELYSSTTNPIKQSNNMKRKERKDTSNYMKYKSKAQIFAYLKFIAYFESNTDNSWNSIKK